MKINVQTEILYERRKKVLDLQKGLVHIYAGNGKGKTTAAVGLGLRAYGRGFRVLLIQFLKNEPSGEIMAIEKLKPDFIYYRTKKVKGLFWDMNDEQKKELKESEIAAFEHASKSVSSGDWDMIILDEIMGSISNGLVLLNDVVELVKNKPERLELVLTGKNIPAELVQLADYISDIVLIKHPFSNGIPARVGIEK